MLTHNLTVLTVENRSSHDIEITTEGLLSELVPATLSIESGDTFSAQCEISVGRAFLGNYFSESENKERYAPPTELRFRSSDERMRFGKAEQLHVHRFVKSQRVAQTQIYISEGSVN